MTDDKKKGDFDQSRKHDEGGNKKQDNSDNTPSRNNIRMRAMAAINDGGAPRRSR